MDTIQTSGLHIVAKLNLNQIYMLRNNMQRGEQLEFVFQNNSQLFLRVSKILLGSRIQSKGMYVLVSMNFYNIGFQGIIDNSFLSFPASFPVDILYVVTLLFVGSFVIRGYIHMPYFEIQLEQIQFNWQYLISIQDSRGCTSYLLLGFPTYHAVRYLNTLKFVMYRQEQEYIHLSLPWELDSFKLGTCEEQPKGWGW
eukprot:TRINITY_DN4192_c0_g1_i1.p2 TRINITY_DN4192_c0_g1~~TRINITY_DN4192_c0_g1_i1.p2  ORF type:complete len:197 (-),score=-0.86 TRINITY_DN4192_c0_g1_i1:379-969(-)